MVSQQIPRKARNHPYGPAVAAVVWVKKCFTCKFFEMAKPKRSPITWKDPHFGAIQFPTTRLIRQPTLEDLTHPLAGTHFSLDLKTASMCSRRRCKWFNGVASSVISVAIPFKTGLWRRRPMLSIELSLRGTQRTSRNARVSKQQKTL
jgi:hypothetical protein